MRGGYTGGIVRAGTVKRQAIEQAWKSTSFLSVIPWTIGRQSKRHELTVEDDEVEKVIKVDDFELPSDPRRFGITKEDIERVGHPDLKGTEEGRQDSRRRRSDSRRPWFEQVRG